MENTTKNLDNDEDREAITMLLLAYQDVFAKDDTDIGKTDVITHDVDTGDASRYANLSVDNQRMSTKRLCLLLTT